MQNKTIPVGLCQCGCGQKTSIATRNTREYRKGQPMRFVHGHAGCRGVRLSLAERFAEKIDTTSSVRGCWLWTAKTNPNGYGRIYDGRKPALAHRVAWTLFVGPIPHGLFVLHRCDNPPCCNPAHLFLGTHADNMRDKVQKGRQGSPRGEEASSAKLTAESVLLIRAAVASGRTQTEVGRKFGIHNSQVSRIVNRKVWTHLP